MKFIYFLLGLITIGILGASPQIKQPVDQTDIFAIPLDEDEEEQEEELKSLEHPKK